MDRSGNLAQLPRLDARRYPGLPGLCQYGIEGRSSDTQVLACAQAEGRVLVTFDKDFGELAFHSGLPASSGVALFRISAPSSAHVARVAVASSSSPGSS